MNTADKLREYLWGERDWEQMDMARECLAEIERLEIECAEAYMAGRDMPLSLASDWEN